MSDKTPSEIRDLLNRYYAEGGAQTEAELELCDVAYQAIRLIEGDSLAAESGEYGYIGIEYTGEQ